MSIVTIQLPASLQVLIDSRLDTIDRMLMGRMPRQDRLAIVSEVESQIHEKLLEREDHEWDRDDILALLARLDPPEAFIPEPSDDDVSPPRVTVSYTGQRTARRVDSRTARLSGILGLTMLGGVLVGYPLIFTVAEFLSSEGFLLGGFGMASLIIITGSILGLVFGLRARSGGGWAVAGIVTSLVALLLGFVGLSGLFLFLN